MPNINLLPTINTATDNNSYFVVSDNGLVRRFKLENLVTQLQQAIPDANRTDQYLFTTTDVTFRSINLYDKAGNIGTNERLHGFQASAFHEDGSALKRTDYLGGVRFGGFDGKFNTLDDHGLSTAGISSIAIEDWENNSTSTIRAGSMMSFYIQPVKTQLSDSSRSTFLSAITTKNGLVFLFGFIVVFVEIVIHHLIRMAKEYINNENPLVLANSDQLVDWNSREFLYDLLIKNADGGIAR